VVNLRKTKGNRRRKGDQEVLHIKKNIIVAIIIILVIEKEKGILEKGHLDLDLNQLLIQLLKTDIREKEIKRGMKGIKLTNILLVGVVIIINIKMRRRDTGKREEDDLL
jgi:hypothetical protein